MRACASVSLATGAPFVFAVEWLRCPDGRADTRKRARAPRRLGATRPNAAAPHAGVPARGRTGSGYGTRVGIWPIWPSAISPLTFFTASRSLGGTFLLIVPRPTPFSLRPKIAFRPPRHVPSWIDLIVAKTAASTFFWALVSTCGPRNAWSASTPIPHTFSSRAASRAPSPQPPATWNTTPAPRPIWFRASSLHFAWSSQSDEYPLITLIPGSAFLAPAW